MSLTSLVVRELGLCEYETTMVSMQTFTNRREKNTQDEIWLLQHPPVFTRGVSCRQLPNRLLPSTMKVVDSDRGGQITYHGPGQLVVYLLLDLRRRQLGVRSFVSLLETVIIDVLGQHGLEAGRRPEAPGVYVGGAKIAALGLRVRSGYCYHGMSLNIDLDFLLSLPRLIYPHLAPNLRFQKGIMAHNKLKDLITKYLHLDLLKNY